MTTGQKKDFRDKFGDLYHQLDMEQWIDNLVDEACKKQREICASIYDEGVTNAVLKPSAMTFMYSKIKNAPLPKESEL